MIDVNSAQFETQVLERSKLGPVVVDFWAPWCGPCRTLGPVLERLEGEGKNADGSGAKWTLVKINTDENQALSQRFQIQGIPAVKAFVDGKVVAEFVGAQPEAKVREWLNGFLPDPAATAAAAARKAAAEGDSAAASALYASALAHDPQNAEGLLHLAARASDAGDAEQALRHIAGLRPRDRARLASEVARIELTAGAPSLAAARHSALVGANAAGQSGTQLRWDLARALLREVPGDYDPAEALEILLAIVKSDRGFSAPTFGSDAARKAMLAVFDTLQATPGGRVVSDEFRRRLSMELYK
jgi:putative thioredoxin